MRRGENMQLRTAILILFVFAQSFTKLHKNGDIRKPKAWSSIMKELFVCIEYLKRLSTLKFHYFFYTPCSALTLFAFEILIYTNYFEHLPRNSLPSCFVYSLKYH